MIDLEKIDYSALDRPEILQFLFYPRKEERPLRATSSATEMLIPVQDNMVVGAKIHHAEKSSPTILFFHGNGEVVSDYDDVGPVYTDMGIGFLPVDYRGYGLSTGRPTVTGMMRDCHTVFVYVKKWLADNGYHGPLVVMGRSLGSASALELAAHYQAEFDGLILESGFAYATPLLRLLGIDTEALGIGEGEGLKNIDKIKNYSKPMLIIHAEYDQIIPISDGEALFNACKSNEKNMLRIPNADHNTLFYYGARAYLEAVQNLIQSVA